MTKRIAFYTKALEFDLIEDTASPIAGLPDVPLPPRPMRPTDPILTCSCSHGVSPCAGRPPDAGQAGASFRRCDEAHDPMATAPNTMAMITPG